MPDTVDDLQTGPSPTAQASRPRRALGLLSRVLLPVAILAGGTFAFLKLSVEPEKPKLPPAPPQAIRTRALEPQVRDYQVIVKTHGVVRPHDEVTLSAQVSGLIAQISPSFEAGSYFKAGDILVELEAEDYQIALAVAEARLKGAQSALQLATLNHERNLKIFREKLIPEAEVDQTSAIRLQAAAEVDSALALVERSRKDLDRTRIRAPFDGRVRHKAVGLGQSVGTGTSLGGIFAVDFAEVRLPIAANELPFLDLPEKQDDPPLDVELRDGIAGAADTVWKAKIIRTEGTLDENSLELFAIARVDDPFGLKSGMRPLRLAQPVTAAIAGRTLTNVVALPRITVRQLDQIVLIDKAELTLVPKTIVPIWSDEQFIVVRDPQLTSGHLLATTHLVYAPKGSKVEIIPDLGTAPVTAGATSNAVTNHLPSATSKDGNKKS